VSAEDHKHHKNHKDHHDHDNHNNAGSTASLKQKMHNDNAQEAIHAQLLEHPSYIELQTKLTEAEEKANQYWDRMLRMQAETENTQRRVQRDVENAHKYGLEKFVLELLPVIDSLERSMTLPDDQQHTILEGVKMTLNMLYSALDKFNVKQVDPISQPFNPEFHQAVSTAVDSKVPPNTVKDVLQKGYLLNNRLIRPALVVVSKAS
jgi:molecular chaperone GrpE